MQVVRDEIVRFVLRELVVVLLARHVAVNVVTLAWLVVPERGVERLAAEFVAFNAMRNPALLPDGVVQLLHPGQTGVAIDLPAGRRIGLFPQHCEAHAGGCFVAASVNHVVAQRAQRVEDIVELGERLAEVALPGAMVCVLNPTREVTHLAAVHVAGQACRAVPKFVVALIVVVVVFEEIVLQALRRDAVAHYAFSFGARRDGRERKQAKQNDGQQPVVILFNHNSPLFSNVYWAAAAVGCN